LEFEYVYNAVYDTGNYVSQNKLPNNLISAAEYDKNPFDANYLGSLDNTQTKLGYDFSVIAIDFSRFVSHPGDSNYDPFLHERLDQINQDAKQNNGKILNFASQDNYDS